MEPIEENSSQSFPPSNIVEEERDLLLQAHQLWQRSQQAGLRKSTPEDVRLGEALQQEHRDFFHLDLRKADFRNQDLRMLIFKKRIYLEPVSRERIFVAQIFKVRI